MWEHIRPLSGPTAGTARSSRHSAGIRHPGRRELLLAGEGDVRVIMQNDRAEIKKMVLSMVETARMSGGYFLASGNDIGWNVPPEAIRYYLDITAELGYR
jgi:hypothetical protein